MVHLPSSHNYQDCAPSPVPKCMKIEKNHSFKKIDVKQCQWVFVGRKLHRANYRKALRL